MVDTEKPQGPMSSHPSLGHRGMEVRTSWPGPAACSRYRTHRATEVTHLEGPSAPGLYAWPSAPSILPHRGL